MKISVVLLVASLTLSLAIGDSSGHPKNHDGGNDSPSILGSSHQNNGQDADKVDRRNDKGVPHNEARNKLPLKEGTYDGKGAEETGKRGPADRTNSEKGTGDVGKIDPGVRTNGEKGTGDVGKKDPGVRTNGEKGTGDVGKIDPGVRTNGEKGAGVTDKRGNAVRTNEEKSAGETAKKDPVISTGFKNEWINSMH